MRLFAEAFLFLILAGVVALLANSLNANGLDLANNYFPSYTDDQEEENGPGPVAVDPSRSKVAQAGLTAVQADGLVAYVKHAVDGSGIFVLDARRPDDFERGRIQNATLCYYYQADDYLPDLLPKLVDATDVFIYCNGGDCEDSIFLARKIMEGGVPIDIVRVYEGGFEEWVELGHPVETGK